MTVAPSIGLPLSRSVTSPSGLFVGLRVKAARRLTLKRLETVSCLPGTVITYSYNPNLSIGMASVESASVYELARFILNVTSFTSSPRMLLLFLP